ncbi:MAG TPA: hypothetical protein VG028_14885 [Terriglobia bacterium]|nr:hypothetical protein [Terriglobia bacterium]
MKTETLAEIVSRLTPERQAMVRKFIEYMEDPASRTDDTPILRAAEEFMAEHPELLRLLAQ